MSCCLGGVDLRNINFMMKLVDSFLNDKISRSDFEIDFETELLARFQKMNRENSEYEGLIYNLLSEKGVGVGEQLSDVDFEALISHQFLGIKDIVENGFV